MRDGKENPEARAGTQLRVQLNLSTKLTDNAVHGGKTEAGALADGLGGEEGLEGVITRGFVHAVPGVGDFEDDEIFAVENSRELMRRRLQEGG